MKIILIIPLILLLVGCATRPQERPHLVPLREHGTTVPPGKVRTVRVPETIKAYRFGRYVDPSNDRVMHEAHTVYRQEVSPQWNLSPNSLAPVSSPADQRSHQPMRDELLMELNRQRQATRVVVQSGEKVSAKLQEVTAALQQSQKLAEQNLRLQQQLKETTKRLDALESREPQKPNPQAEPEFSNW